MITYIRIVRFFMAASGKKYILRRKVIPVNCIRTGENDLDFGHAFLYIVNAPIAICFKSAFTIN